MQIFQDTEWQTLPSGNLQGLAPSMQSRQLCTSSPHCISTQSFIPQNTNLPLKSTLIPDYVPHLLSSMSDESSDHSPLSRNQLYHTDLLTDNDAVHSLETDRTQQHPPSQAAASPQDYKYSIACPTNHSKELYAVSPVSSGSDIMSALLETKVKVDPSADVDDSIDSDVHHNPINLSHIIHRNECWSSKIRLDKAVGTNAHAIHKHKNKGKDSKLVDKVGPQIYLAYSGEVHLRLSVCGQLMHPKSLRATSEWVHFPGDSACFITKSCSLFMEKAASKSEATQTACASVKNLQIQTTCMRKVVDKQIQSSSQNVSNQTQTECQKVKSISTSTEGQIHLIKACGGTQTLCGIHKNTSTQTAMDQKPALVFKTTQCKPIESHQISCMTSFIQSCDKSTTTDNTTTPPYNVVNNSDISQNLVYSNPYADTKGDSWHFGTTFSRSPTEFHDAVALADMSRLERTAMIASSTHSFPSLEVYRDAVSQCGLCVSGEYIYLMDISL